MPNETETLGSSFHPSGSDTGGSNVDIFILCSLEAFLRVTVRFVFLVVEKINPGKVSNKPPFSTAYLASFAGFIVDYGVPKTISELICPTVTSFAVNFLHPPL